MSQRKSTEKKIRLQLDLNSDDQKILDEIAKKFKCKADVMRTGLRLLHLIQEGKIKIVTEDGSIPPALILL